MNKSNFGIILAGLAILLLLGVLIPAFVPGYDAGFPFFFARNSMGPWHSWGGGMFVFPFIMLIVMLFVVYMIFGRGNFRPPWQNGSRHSDPNQSFETALDILKKRYANGEITKEQFEQMKKDIL